MEQYVTIEKLIGETPLQALEKYRAAAGLSQEVKMAYAGRLDPMASGALLVLIGDECKRQTKYHALDKEYVFEVLLGVSSDTGDVLGMLTYDKSLPTISPNAVHTCAKKFSGKTIKVPYPHFSSKTVQGKPLHVWTLEDRLSEIEIPTTQISIHSLKYTRIRTVHINQIYQESLEKINTIPEITEASKALGSDFRRVDVRLSWKTIKEMHPNTIFTVATFTCICGSGSYMRSLSEKIGEELGTQALAYNIHRTKIGTYRRLPFGFGYWKKQF